MAAALLFAGPAQAAPAGKSFRLDAGRVTPKQAMPFSVKPIRFHFRFRAAGPLRLRVLVRRLGSGRVIRRAVTGRLAPGKTHHRFWDGRTQRGRLAPAGRYRVLIGPPGGKLRRAGWIRIRGHQFPVAARHGKRGYIGRFGAPRTGGRTHHGFDITARCGSPLVAVRAGTIFRKAYDPRLDGHYVVLKGEGERRLYRYSHLRRPAPVRRGQKVRAGRRLGSVGQTGNAASTPCHLHFELRTRGRLRDPEPFLRAWDW